MQACGKPGWRSLRRHLLQILHVHVGGASGGAASGWSSEPAEAPKCAACARARVSVRW